MKNLLGITLGALSAPFSHFFYYSLACFPFAPRSYFPGYIGFWVVCGFLGAKLVRRWPGLPLGYSGAILVSLFSRFSHLGAAVAHAGGCGNCYWGSVASLSAACFASGMLGGSLYCHLNCKGNPALARIEIGLNSSEQSASNKGDLV